MSGLRRGYHLVHPPGSLDTAEKQRIHADVAHVTNARIARTQAVRGQAFAVSMSSVPRWLAFAGVRVRASLGQGAYGKVFLVDAGPALSALAGTFLSPVYGYRPLPASGQVALKVALPRSHEPWDAFIDLSAHEAHVHGQLSGDRPWVGSGCTRAMRTSEFVPQMYVAGVPPGARMYMTLMQAVGPDPVPLLSVHVSPQLYVEVERAVVAMWLSGIAHADLHMENILVTRDGRPWIIDFGWAVMLDGARTSSLRQKLGDALVDPRLRTLANAIWYGTDVGRYVETVIAKRFPLHGWYNPDGKLLRSLYNRVPAHARALIPQLRSAAWGCPAHPGPAVGKPWQPRQSPPPPPRTPSPPDRAMVHVAARRRAAASALPRRRSTGPGAWFRRLLLRR